MECHIRKIEEQDKEKWLELWNGYCEFYNMTLLNEVTEHLWGRILSKDSPVYSIVSENDSGEIYGMANFVVHESTSTLRPICCLQDLFVAPHARSQGIGRKLIDWLLVEMKTANWSRVYWHTRENNYIARGLYDKFTKLNDFVRYVVQNPLN
jgi:ribosomal protein S18 acetylase RimI-like enzyme